MAKKKITVAFIASQQYPEDLAYDDWRNRGDNAYFDDEDFDEDEPEGFDPGEFIENTEEMPGNCGIEILIGIGDHGSKLAQVINLAEIMQDKRAGILLFSDISNSRTWEWIKSYAESMDVSRNPKTKRMIQVYQLVPQDIINMYHEAVAIQKAEDRFQSLKNKKEISHQKEEIK